MMQRMRPVRSAFTLVELLTVMAVIALLVGIIVPSITSARKSAQKTAVRASLKAISDGCEIFKNDHGEYPRSNPATFGDGSLPAQQEWEVGESGKQLTGANLIVDAMIGRDNNGYDPRPTIGNGTPPESNDRWFNGANSRRTRSIPYVPIDGIPRTNDTTRKPKDEFGDFDIEKTMPDIDGLRAPVFLDKWDWPILYYRASPKARLDTRIVQLSTETQPDVAGSGVYDGRDNKVFTNDTFGRPSGVMGNHLINQADLGVPDAQGLSPNNFALWIRSNRASQKDQNGVVTFPRPINGETFLLLSPGYDGRWGNADDVVNFDTGSSDR